MVSVNPSIQAVDFYKSLGFYGGFTKPLTLKEAKRIPNLTIKHYSHPVSRHKFADYRLNFSKKIKNATSIKEVDKIMQKHEQILQSLKILKRNDY